VVKVLRDGVLAEQLTTQGLSHAESYFDWQRITLQVDQAYRRATAA
jgi:hypothetical protein